MVKTNQEDFIDDTGSYMFNIDKEGEALGFKINKNEEIGPRTLSAAVEDEYILSHGDI